MSLGRATMCSPVIRTLCVVAVATSLGCGEERGPRAEAIGTTVADLAWNEAQKLTASDAQDSDTFGISVSVSGDTALVGAYYDDDVGVNGGSAYVFVRDANGVWTQEQKLLAADGEMNDTFGHGVSVDGDTALVGAYGDDGVGAAYVFVRSGGVWTEQDKLTPSDGGGSDAFGFAVALQGDRALVGSPFHDGPGGADSGATYVFERSGGVWSASDKLTPSGSTPSDRFGRALAWSGDTVLIGAPETGGGSAHAFVDVGGTFTEQDELLPSPGDALTLFGISLAVNGDTAVVAGEGEGAADPKAYVYQRSGDTWALEQALTPSSAGGSFGYSVGVQGNVAVVADIHDGSSGAAFVFERTDAWSETQVLIPSNTVGQALFGYSMQLDGDTLIVGAASDDEQGVNSGAAYVFVLEQVADGEVCTDAAECASDYCVDGVCCDTPCGDGATDDCRACDVEGSVGTCSAVSDDPVCVGGSGGSGGTAGAGGTGGAGSGGSPARGADPDEDDGCGCRVPAAQTPLGSSSWVVAGALAALLARRRRARRF